MNEIVRFIGIDFGTSTSVVSYMDYQKKDNKLIPMGNLQSIGYNGGSPLIPTIIKKKNEQGPELYGNEIQDFMLEYCPELIEQEFKMNLGSSVSKEKRGEAIKLTYSFFEYLYREYKKHEKAQNNNIIERRVHVSYPAKWETEQKSLTIDAAYEAFKKFPEVMRDGIYSFDEPTSALYYCLSSEEVDDKAKDELRINKSSFILIIDMGAGTTDIVLYEYIPNNPVKVLAKYPEPGRNSTTFGGREIDEIFREYFARNFPEKLKNMNNISFLFECKKWKESISKFFSYNRELCYKFMPTSLGRDIEYSIDGKQTCWILKDYIAKFPELISSTIEIANNNSSKFKESGSDIDLVILTGGHSQWFFIEEMLVGHWIHGLPGNENIGSGINLPKIKKENWRIIKTSHPQQLVSYGLCQSGIPVDVIQLSNCDIWLDIRLGDSSPKKELVVRKNTKLPCQIKFKKKFSCRIDREDNKISVIITPIIGLKGDDYLDPIPSEVLTNLWSDIVEFFSDDKYRHEEVEIDLTCIFDENQIFSFKGEIVTPGFFGFNTKIALSPSEIAQKIRHSA